MGKLFMSSEGVEFFTPLDIFTTDDDSTVLKLIPGTIRKIVNRDPKPLEIFSVINNPDLYRILQQSQVKDVSHQTSEDMLRIQKLAQTIDEDVLWETFRKVRIRMIARQKFAKNLVEHENIISDENFQHILACINRSDEEIKFLLGMKLG